jgi:hypothetical protein
VFLFAHTVEVKFSYETFLSLKEIKVLRSEEADQFRLRLYFCLEEEGVPV